MYSIEKTGNFLKAIDKYARQQQTKMIEEIREIEKREIEKAEAGIMEDVRNMVQREVAAMKNKITVDISHKELEERKKLAIKRQRIVKDVFTLCAEKLSEFTRTDKYPEILERYASRISDVLKCGDVVLYIRKEDERFINIVKRGFARECKTEYSDKIKIGGIYGFGESLKIIADETLDSKLMAQREWFNETYGVTLI